MKTYGLLIVLGFAVMMVGTVMATSQHLGVETTGWEEVTNITELPWATDQMRWLVRGSYQYENTIQEGLYIGLSSPRAIYFFNPETGFLEQLITTQETFTDMSSNGNEGILYRHYYSYSCCWTTHCYPYYSEYDGIGNKHRWYVSGVHSLPSQMYGDMVGDENYTVSLYDTHIYVYDGSTWTSTTVSLDKPTAVMYDGWVYYTANSGTSRIFRRFNPSTKETEGLTMAPRDIRTGQGFEYAGNLYYLTDANEVLEYDPSSGEWYGIVAILPSGSATGYQKCGVAVLKGKLYALTQNGLYVWQGTLPYWQYNPNTFSITLEDYWSYGGVPPEETTTVRVYFNDTVKQTLEFGVGDVKSIGYSTPARKVKFVYVSGSRDVKFTAWTNLEFSADESQVKTIDDVYAIDANNTTAVFDVTPSGGYEAPEEEQLYRVVGEIRLDNQGVESYLDNISVELYPLASTVTDDYGKFEFSGVNAGTYILKVRLSQLDPSMEDWENALGVSANTSISLKFTILGYENDITQYETEFETEEYYLPVRGSMIPYMLIATGLMMVVAGVVMETKSGKKIGGR